MKLPIRIHSVASSRAATFIPLLRESGIEVVEVSTSDYSRSVGLVIDAVNASTLTHDGQESLNRSVRYVGTNTAGVWVPTGTSDISPLVAVTVAAGGVPVTETKYEGPLVSFR
jgi:hypothetical protein